MMDFYTKSEIDEKFGVTISSKSWRDLYTKTEIEANVGTPETLVLPANMLDFYTKTEVDSIPTQTTLTWPEYKALYGYNDNDDNIKAIYAMAYYRAYYAILIAIIDDVLIGGELAITPGSFSCVTGYYLRNGIKRFGSMYGDNVYNAVVTGQSAPMIPITLVYTQDGILKFSMIPTYLAQDTFDIRKSFSGLIFNLTLRRNASGDIVASLVFDGSGMFDSVTQSVRSGHFQNRYIRAYNGSPLEFTQTSDYLAGSSSAGGLLLGEIDFMTDLPTSDEFPTITAANAFDYIENVLNPWIVEQNPSLEQHLFHPTA